jgi:hypothetical protein
MAVLRGEEGTTYTQLEDSLATYARMLVAAATPQAAPGSPARRADGTVDRNDDDAPSVRRRPQQRTTTSKAPVGGAPAVPKE